MASINQKATSEHLPHTHEGALASQITAEEQLRRSVLACLLWEDSFYENGVDIADRIIEGVSKVTPEFASALGKEARNVHNLRHVPLLLALGLVRKGHNIKEMLVDIIQRPDELTEFLALYWKDGKKPLDNSVMKGLAKAFGKFDEYQLAKYDKDSKAIKLRDVLKLCHPKPKDEEQAALWKRLLEGTLKTPDTWEVGLSKGEGKKSKEDKKEVWEKLLKEHKLGGFALIRNLRNMVEANVDRLLIEEALITMKTNKILPFRFIAAAKVAPTFEAYLEKALLRNLEELPKIDKRAVILVDVSGSMEAPISGKSDLSRIDAACGVALIAKEMFKDVRVFAFSEQLAEVAPRRGFALMDAIKKSMHHGGTMLGGALHFMEEAALKSDPRDVLIVFTDEQSHDRVQKPFTPRGYMVNVASYQNGVGYRSWIHVDGFSEAVMKWIAEMEKSVF